MDDHDDSQVYFAPEIGNVVFASAVDGWAVTVQHFSKTISQKYGMSEEVLRKTLWGDFYMDSKRKRILRGAQAKAKKPIFVQIVLENIWAAYDAIVTRKDKVMTEKIVSSLKLNLTKRDSTHTDVKVQLSAIMGEWLPIASTLLSVVCSLLPSPLQLSAERAERLMCSNLHKFESLPSETQVLKDDFMRCSSSSEATKIAFVSKMFCVERKQLPENRQRALTHAEIAFKREQARLKALEQANAPPVPKVDIGDVSTPMSNSEYLEDPKVDENEEVFIAFARVFSGILKKGDTVYVLGPKHNPANRLEAKDIDKSFKVTDLSSSQHVTVARIDRLFILMGRELEAVDEVPAGNMVGIGSLGDHVLKSATLSDSLYCPAFIDLHVSAKPILRVAIEPENPHDMPSLVKGLKLLNQADPNVEVRMQESGEHVIITTGEMHLQKCVDDLTERFAKVALNVSKPIVPFKETIIVPPTTDMVNEVIGDKNWVGASDAKNPTSTEAIQIFTPNKKSSVKLRAVPLPETVTELIENESALLRMLCSRKTNSVELKMETLEAISKLRETLRTLFTEAGAPWNSNSVDLIWSFGPKFCGPNILLNAMPEYEIGSMWEKRSGLESASVLLDTYYSNFISGFQLATLAGPLCEEPMIGVAYVVESWTMSSDIEQQGAVSDPYGPFGGQVMSTVKEGCRRAFQSQPQRLRMAMYSCTIQVSSDALGK